MKKGFYTAATFGIIGVVGGLVSVYNIEKGRRAGKPYEQISDAIKFMQIASVFSMGIAAGMLIAPSEK